MQLSGLLARLTPDERATLLERRLGPNAVALDDRALVDQLAQPHAVGAALARLNSAQLLLLRWLSTRPGLQATWPELLEAIGDRLTSELLTAYLHDLKLWGLVDYDPRPKDGFFVTYPAVAARLPARRGVHLGPTLSELSNEILLKVCAQLGVGNALTRKAARSQLVASALADTSRCRAVVEGLPGPARSLFDWIRDQGGFVSTATLMKRLKMSQGSYVALGSVSSFWSSAHTQATDNPLTDLVRRLLVIPVMPYPGAWYGATAFAIPTEVEGAYSGLTLFDTAALRPPPLTGAEAVDGVVPNPGNLLRDLGHLLGFIGSGRCEWRQDGQPYKRSLVALGKALGNPDGEYAERLWRLARSAELVLARRYGQADYQVAAIGDATPREVVAALLVAWVRAGAYTLVAGVSAVASQAARTCLLELLRIIPADTWLLRSSVEGQLRFHWPTVFASEYLQSYEVAPEPGWDSLGNLILAHGKTPDGQEAVMLPASHQSVLADPAGPASDDSLLPPWDTSWIVQPDRSIVVPPNAHPDALADLWKVANLESNQGASVFRVSVESITAALNAYLTPTQIRSLLQKGSRVPLPPTVERLIDDQGQRYGRIKVGVAHTYVKTDDPALLEELRRDKKLSKLDWRDVAPCVAFVASADPSSVIESLRRSGYLPVADEEPPAPRNGSPTLRAVPTRQPTPVDTGSMSKADRRALLRLVNTAIESDISLVTTWVEKGRPRTTELEMIDLHDDELHAFDLEDDSREVLVPIRSILELQAGGMLVDDPYGDEGP